MLWEILRVTFTLVLSRSLYQCSLYQCFVKITSLKYKACFSFYCCSMEWTREIWMGWHDDQKRCTILIDAACQIDRERSHWGQKLGFSIEKTDVFPSMRTPSMFQLPSSEELKRHSERNTTSRCRRVCLKIAKKHFQTLLNFGIEIKISI